MTQKIKVRVINSSALSLNWHSEPGIQHHLLPATFTNHGRSMANTFKGPNTKSIHGYADHIYTLRQYSRGNLKIKSANPHQHPAIDPNSLSHPEDFPQMVKARVTLDRTSESQCDLIRRIAGITTGNPGSGLKTNKGTLCTRCIKTLPRR